MGFKEKILNRSGSYRAFKANLDKVKKLEKEVQDMNTLFNDLYVNFTHTPSPLLQNLRDLSYEGLIFIDNICEKYGLEYWLDYGTLLGAIRHGDFIPWDDDVDISMMRKDYDVICDVLDDEIKAHNLKHVFTVYKHKPSHKKPNYRWIQFRCSWEYPGYRLSLMNIDIFPYDYIKSYNEETIDEEFQKYRFHFHKQIMNKVPYEDAIKEHYDRFDLTLEKQDHYIPGPEDLHGTTARYPLDIRKTDELFPLKRINFGGHNLLAPNNPDHTLKSLYGKNYLRIPRSVRHHGRLGKLRKEENIMEKYDEVLESFRLANENF